MLDAWSPLRRPLFRALWIANLTSNIGTWLQEVGGAWLMTSLAPTPLMVALVRAAWTLPVFALALPAGALADILDRRRFLIGTQLWMLISAAALAILTYLDLTTPMLLLLLTFSLGLGLSMNAPAWQALIPELVPRTELRTAITLGSISFNIARAVGPALGGLLIALAGPEAAFSLNAVSFLAVVVVLFRWQRTPQATNLPAERFLSAIVSGVRYVRHSPPLHAVLIRLSLLIGFASALAALLPLIARVQLQQGPSGYGALVGIFGIGAVSGAAMIPTLRRRLSHENLITLATVVFATAEAGMAYAHNFYMAGTVLLLGGGAWLTLLSSFHTAAQTTLPSWVRARALSIYLLVFFGGMAAGSAFWGVVANRIGIPATLLLSAAGLILTLGAALVYRLPLEEGTDLTPTRHWADPTTALEFEAEHGPVMVTVEYRVDEKDSKDFLRAIDQLRRMRRRDGAMRWGLFQDTAQPNRYMEYFVVETWVGHVRQHQRVTREFKDLEDRVRSFHRGTGPPRVSHFVAPPAWEGEWEESEKATEIETTPSVDGF